MEKATSRHVFTQFCGPCYTLLESSGLVDFISEVQKLTYLTGKWASLHLQYHFRIEEVLELVFLERSAGSKFKLDLFWDRIIHDETIWRRCAQRDNIAVCIERQIDFFFHIPFILFSGGDASPFLSLKIASHLFIVSLMPLWA